MNEFEFSVACMSGNHALCEWCGCWCHDDDDMDPNLDDDELEFTPFFDDGGEG